MIKFFFLLFAGVLAGNVLFAQTGSNAPVPAANQPNIQPISTSKGFTLDIDWNSPQYYKLVSIQAVDINKKHSPAEMESFKNEAASEFAKTDIAIDLKQGVWYMRNKQQEGNDLMRDLNITDDKLQWVGCEKCKENSYSIVELNDTRLVLQVVAQDEGQHFFYQFEFKK